MGYNNSNSNNYNNNFSSYNFYSNNCNNNFINYAVKEYKKINILEVYKTLK